MLKIWFIFKMAFGAIFKNKVRSFLSILGIAIGIAAVIAMLGLGNGAQASIQKNVDELGSNTITISTDNRQGFNRLPNPANPRSSFTRTPTALVPITESEYDFLAQTVPTEQANIQAVTGTVQETFQVHLTNQELINVQGFAVTENYFQVLNLNTALGKSTLEPSSADAVLGHSLAEEIADTREVEVSELIGSVVKLNAKKFTIVGILKETESLLQLTTNSAIFISTEKYFRENPNERYYSSVIYSVKDIARLGETRDAVETALRDYREIDEDQDLSFTITTTEDLASTITEITNIITLLLSGISGISLLVGGIGISNIMLVSVTERTKEIGLRKAIGAKRIYILAQFLLESILLTLIGGTLGVVVGYLLATGVGNTVDIAAQIKTENILLATGICSFVGLFFGFVPALNASRLSPVEALRYE